MRCLALFLSQIKFSKMLIINNINYSSDGGGDGGGEADSDWMTMTALLRSAQVNPEPAPPLAPRVQLTLGRVRPAGPERPFGFECCHGGRSRKHPPTLSRRLGCCGRHVLPAKGEGGDSERNICALELLHSHLLHWLSREGETRGRLEICIHHAQRVCGPEAGFRLSGRALSEEISHK